MKVHIKKLLLNELKIPRFKYININFRDVLFREPNMINFYNLVIPYNIILFEKFFPITKTPLLIMTCLKFIYILRGDDIGKLTGLC